MTDPCSYLAADVAILLNGLCVTHMALARLNDGINSGTSKNNDYYTLVKLETERQLFC